LVYITGTQIDDIIDIDDSLDIVVLAPSFCWFKVLEIPTKNLRKAKKIADHILGDRPAQYTDIEIVKFEDKFKVYCYNKSQVEDIIKSLGKSYNKVYFAYELTDSLINLIDNNSFLKYFKTIKDELKTKKPILKLNMNRQNSLKKIVMINIFLFISMFIYTLTQFNVLSQIDDKINSLKDDGKSSYELKSSIKSYISKDKKSKNMKDSLTKLLKKQKNLKSIEYKKGKFYTSKSEGKS